jgi:molecular chaperone DnaK
VKAAFEKLQASQTKLGEAIYAQAGSPDGATGTAGAEGAAGAKTGSSDEDIVDAEIVDEEEKK